MRSGARIVWQSARAAHTGIPSRRVLLIGNQKPAAVLWVAGLNFRVFYSLGMMIQNSKYSSNPGTPPGSSEIRNAIRNHKGAIPKNSPKPPQTPAMMRLRRDRRKAPRALFIVSLLPNINPGLLVNQFHYNLRKVGRIVAIQTGKTCQEIFTATSIPSPAG